MAAPSYGGPYRAFLLKQTFLWAGCTSGRPTNSVKALKGHDKMPA